MSTDESNQPEVLIFFLSGDKIVDLYNKLYIKNGYSVPFDILSGQHSYAGYNRNGKDKFGINPDGGINNNNANEDFKKIISNFWMLVPEMKIEFNNNSILKQLINKMNLLIPEDGLKKVPDMVHFYDNIVVKDMSPGDGELYLNSEYGKNNKTYYSDDKLYNNMQYFILPNTDIDGLKENIQSSFKTNQNVTCNITCKFINVDILQPDNIDKYKQLFTSGKITKVFIGDDFFDKENNKTLLDLLLVEQQKQVQEQEEEQEEEQVQQQNTPEVILLPCLYKENSTNKCQDNDVEISQVCKEFKNKNINTKIYTNFYGDEIVRKPRTLTSNYNSREHCRDNTIIGIVLDNFYSNSDEQVNRIGYGGKRRKPTKKTKKTRKPRKKSRKSRKSRKLKKITKTLKYTNKIKN